MNDRQHCPSILDDLGAAGGEMSATRALGEAMEDAGAFGSGLARATDDVAAAGARAATAQAGQAIGEGSFSPSPLFRQMMEERTGAEGLVPDGPMRILPGDEYGPALAAKKAANAIVRNEAKGSGFGLADYEIHEKQPVFLGGSPTDPANKVALPYDLHRDVSGLWEILKRCIQRGGLCGKNVYP